MLGWYFLLWRNVETIVYDVSLGTSTDCAKVLIWQHISKDSMRRHDFFMKSLYFWLQRYWKKTILTKYIKQIHVCVTIIHESVRIMSFLTFKITRKYVATKQLSSFLPIEIMDRNAKGYFSHCERLPLAWWKATLYCMKGNTLQRCFIPFCILLIFNKIQSLPPTLNFTGCPFSSEALQTVVIQYSRTACAAGKGSHEVTVGLQLQHLLVNPSSAALLSSSGVKMLHIRKYCCNFADETFQAIIFDTRRRQSGVLWLLL